MELECIEIEGCEEIYMISSVKKEFSKAVSENWKDNPPWQRYQKKLIGDLVVLQADKEKAIELASFEKVDGEDNLYSIRHPEGKKNVRVLYSITDDREIVLLTAFLENNTNDYKLAIRRAKVRMKWLYSD